MAMVQVSGPFPFFDESQQPGWTGSAVPHGRTSSVTTAACHDHREAGTTPADSLAQIDPREHAAQRLAEAIREVKALLTVTDPTYGACMSLADQLTQHIDDLWELQTMARVRADDLIGKD